MSILDITETAKKHLIAFMTSKNLNEIQLRLKSAGCTGWKYQLDENISKFPNERFTLTEELTILVEAHDLSIVQGTRIDLEQKGLSSVLVFINPAATSICGCGESFKV